MSYIDSEFYQQIFFLTKRHNIYCHSMIIALIEKTLDIIIYFGEHSHLDHVQQVKVLIKI